MMQVLTMATKNHMEKARVLEAKCGALGIAVHICEFPECFDGKTAATMKPRVIQEYMKHTRKPFWWVDADDIVLAPFDEPEQSVTVGLVENPELNAPGFKTELRIASCVHYWTWTAEAFRFADVWETMLMLSLNDHRALIAAYYAVATWWLPKGPGVRLPFSGIVDVTASVRGRYTMTGNGRRPECKL